MQLPKIDLSSLPDLATKTGMFGSMRWPSHDDTVVVIAAIVYTTSHPNGLF